MTPQTMINYYYSFPFVDVCLSLYVTELNKRGTEFLSNPEKNSAKTFVLKGYIQANTPSDAVYFHITQFFAKLFCVWTRS